MCIYMAYAAQLKKRHARFQAAVLRNLFHPSSPSPSPSHASSPSSSAPKNLKAPEIQVEVYPGDSDHRAIQSDLPSIQLLWDETSSHEAKQTIELDTTVMQNVWNSKDGELTKSYLSRSQRKRIKQKILKESLEKSGEAKRFVGPLLPVSIEHKQRLCDSIPASPENSDTKLEKEKELYQLPPQAELVTQTDTCDTSVSLSRTKRRRLAKKKCSNVDNRHLPKSSTFTAEIKGASFVIKKM